MRRLAVVLWSSFLVAIVAEGVVFSMLDPMAVFPGERHAALPPVAVYTLGFFLFWFFGALAGLVSTYLLQLPAKGSQVLPRTSDAPPFSGGPSASDQPGLPSMRDHSSTGR